MAFLRICGISGPVLLLAAHSELLVAPCMVFLTQPDLKQEGIAGLGAFVKSSDKLVVLWSSRYFTRLWFVYELGCFLKRSKPLELKILPVKTTAILLLALLDVVLLLGS